MGNQARVVSAAFAFSGFAVATASGLAAGNAADRVLLQALLAMVGCQCVGMIAGEIVTRVIADHEAGYRKTNPVPEVPVSPSPRREGIVVVDEIVDESGGVSRAAA